MSKHHPDLIMCRRLPGIVISARRTRGNAQSATPTSDQKPSATNVTSGRTVGDALSAVDLVYRTHLTVLNARAWRRVPQDRESGSKQNRLVLREEETRVQEGLARLAICDILTLGSLTRRSPYRKHCAFCFPLIIPASVVPLKDQYQAFVSPHPSLCFAPCSGWRHSRPFAHVGKQTIS